MSLPIRYACIHQVFRPFNTTLGASHAPRRSWSHYSWCINHIDHEVSIPSSWPLILSPLLSLTNSTNSSIAIGHAPFSFHHSRLSPSSSFVLVTSSITIFHKSLFTGRLVLVS